MMTSAIGVMPARPSRVAISPSLMQPFCGERRLLRVLDHGAVEARA